MCSTPEICTFQILLAFCVQCLWKKVRKKDWDYKNRDLKQKHNLVFLNHYVKTQ